MEPKKNNVQKKDQLVRLVGVHPTAWDKINDYIFNTPVSFANSKRAAEVQDLLSQFILIDVPADQIMQAPEKKKEEEKTEQK